MAYLIKRIEEQLQKEGYKPRTNKARDWLKSKMLRLKPSKQALMSDRERLKGKSIIGKMYFYFYNPKTKETLPYYDIFPLVIPIENHTDGFIGLNLHYIHPKNRMILLDKLSEFATNSRYDEKTRLRLSYSLLASSSRIFEMTPCIKKYLYKHIESRFLEIQANEWDIAALLPVETFVGATNSKVWAESRKKF